MFPALETNGKRRKHWSPTSALVGTPGSPAREHRPPSRNSKEKRIRPEERPRPIADQSSEGVASKRRVKLGVGSGTFGVLSRVQFLAIGEREAQSNTLVLTLSALGGGVIDEPGGIAATGSGGEIVHGNHFNWILGNPLQP